MSSTLRAFSRTSCKLPPRKCLNNLFLSEDKAKQRQETLYSHNVQIDGTDRSYVNNLAFHLKELEKLEQPKSQGGGRKGTIRLEQKFKRTMQMITIKSWFFERHFNMLFCWKVREQTHCSWCGTSAVVIRDYYGFPKGSNLKALMDSSTQILTMLDDDETAEWSSTESWFLSLLLKCHPFEKYLHQKVHCWLWPSISRQTSTGPSQVDSITQNRKKIWPLLSC